MFEVPRKRARPNVFSWAKEEGRKRAERQRRNNVVGRIEKKKPSTQKHNNNWKAI
jgi:hypothetical protein